MKKKFDAVGWTRKRRIEMDSEDVGLSLKQRRDKVLGLLEADPLWKKFKDRLVKPGETLDEQLKTKAG